MASRDHGAVVKGVKTLFDSGTTLALGDSQLLERFLLRADEGAEAAFSALVERHGPMVERVCRGVLRDVHAAEDAFQATFLILARKGASIRRRASVSSWLFGVARRVARRADFERKRRAMFEQRGLAMAENDAAIDRPAELLPEIQEEVDRLPEKYRAPIVLCYLEGMTHEQAAGHLGLPAGTVKVRLMRARERLRGRLIRRGLAPSLLAALLAGKAGATVPHQVMNSTIKAALEIAAGRSVAISAPAVVAALVQGVINAMFLTRLKSAALLLATSLVAILGSIVVLSAVPGVVRSAQTPPIRPEGAKQQTPNPAAAETKGDVLTVAAGVVGKSDISRAMTASASVSPYESASLFAKVSGFAKSITVDIGDSVKRGQVLVELSVPEVQVDLERSQAVIEQTDVRVMKTKSLVEVAKAAVDSERAKIEVARSQLEGADASLRYRKLQFDRLAKLAKDGQVEQRLVDESKENLEAARSGREEVVLRMTVARADLATAQAKVNAAQIDVREASADRKVAVADAARAQILVNYTRVVAPWDGIVTKRECNEGDFVRSGELSGAVPILTVVKTGKVRVIVHVTDNHVPYLNQGDPAEIRFDAPGFRVYRGTVARIAEAEENGRMRAEIDLDNDDGRLKAGQSGQVTIHLEEKQGVRTIPMSALVERFAGDQAICYRIENNRAVRTPIKTGLGDGVRIEVIEGLKDGDRVITRFEGSLADGQEVVVKDAAELKKDRRPLR